MGAAKQDQTIGIRHPHPFADAAGRLYGFLQEIYGDQPSETRIEVEVEALSGGTYGTPHLETTDVRVYAGDTQQLPDFEGVPYWKEMLAAHPNLFSECRTHQDRLDTVKALLERERLYLDVGLDWPDVNEKISSPLHFTLEELRLMARKRTSHADGLEHLDTESLPQRKDEHSYAYLVSLTTHQMLYQEVIVESETPLSEKEIIARALPLVGNEWEPGPIDENPDVEQVQPLRHQPKEQKWNS